MEKNAHIRIAIVQMDFNPAAFIRYTDLLKEPTKISPEEIEDSIANSRSDNKKINNKLAEIKEKIKYKYISYLEKKISYILCFCGEKNVDLVIFPEYSIPAECLLSIHNFVSQKRNINIVAGSHSVLEENNTIYEKINLSNWKNWNNNQKEDMIRKAISPIFYASGKVTHVEKMNRTQRMDSDFKEGTWKLPPMFTIKDKTYTAPVFICLDYITKPVNNPFEKKYSNADFLIVTSYTPDFDSFYSKASETLKRENKAVIYVNAFDKGGSKVFCHFDPPQKQQLDNSNDNIGTYSIPEAEEGIVIVSIDPKKQFTIKPTPAKSYDASIQEGVYPFVYSFSHKNTFDICTKIKNANSLSEKKQLLSHHKIEICQWSDSSKIYQVKTKRLFSHNLIKEEIDFFVDCIYFDSIVSPTKNRIETLDYMVKELRKIANKYVSSTDDDNLVVNTGDLRSGMALLDVVIQYASKSETLKSSN